ncbi:NitT/TauT family transport system substrate-binding protein [Nitrobacteraceae bacterium AZCC 2161]
MDDRHIAQRAVRNAKRETPFDRLTRRDLLRAGAGAIGAATLGAPSIARAEGREIPFSLDFRIYGGNSPFFFGEESGINKDLGFSMKLDGAPGSGEAVGRVASGSHAFAFADATTLVEFTARNPNEAPKMILGIFDRFPACVLSFSKKPIDTLKDLEGARIGIGAASAATKVLPALLERNNIDPKKVNWTTVDVKLRDSLLLRGAIDGVIGFDYTSIFNLIDAGAKMEDLHFLYFSNFGFSFPSNALIASRAMVEKEPELCKRVALATARAWKASVKNPAATIAAVVKREPLLQTKVEVARLEWVLNKHVLTENVHAHGMGNIDPSRMASGMSIIKEGFGLAAAPELAQYYDGRFLPDASELKLV